MIINSDYTNISTPDGGRCGLTWPHPNGKGSIPASFSSLTFSTERADVAVVRASGRTVSSSPRRRSIIASSLPDPSFLSTTTAALAGSRMPGKTTVAQFDIDCRAALGYLSEHEQVAPEKFGAAGFCLGGHLAFRAALQPEVRATVCFGTGIHNGKLGQDADAGSLQRAAEIGGDLFMVWGTLDPHIPAEARELIDSTLRICGTKFSSRLYPAEHAFMRDEGPRYDSESTDHAFGDMISLYRRIFPRYATIIVPVPLSVKISESNALRLVPLMMCALCTPRRSSSMMLCSFGIIPPVALPSSIRASASSAVRRESFVSGSSSRRKIPSTSESWISFSAAAE